MWGIQAARKLARTIRRATPTHVGNTIPTLPGLVRNRSTPTHEGNTKQALATTTTSTVHPHACGEYCGGDVGRKRLRGPPPRVWGIRVHPWGGGYTCWSTPTHVGNTSAACLATALQPVHPHACGEHDKPKVLGKPIAGPPPRMWGTRSRYVVILLAARSTPTHVGNTLAWQASGSATPVHPHACGEYVCRL